MPPGLRDSSVLSNQGFIQRKALESASATSSKASAPEYSNYWLIVKAARWLWGCGLVYHHPDQLEASLRTSGSSSKTLVAENMKAVKSLLAQAHTYTNGKLVGQISNHSASEMRRIGTT